MADTLTAHYGWTKPEVGASSSTWGNKLNTDLDSIDNSLWSVSVRATACLPKDGSEPMTGALTTTGVTSSGPVSGTNGSFSGTLSVTGAATFGAMNVASISVTGAGTFGSLSVTGSAVFNSTVTATTAPTLPSHLTNKTYVDAADTAILAKTVSAGTGLTGGGAISGNPTIGIAAGGVGNAQLAANAVGTANIIDANVTPAKLSQPLTQGVAQTASGTAVTFSSIPSWAKRITVSMENVAFATPYDSIIVQIGPSGGLETSGYSYTLCNINGGSLTARADVSVGGGAAGFQLSASANPNPVTGTLVLTNLTGNTWVLSGNLGGYALNNVLVVTGSKALAGALSQLAIRGGIGRTFSGGTINIQYE